MESLVRGSCIMAVREWGNRASSRMEDLAANCKAMLEKSGLVDASDDGSAVLEGTLYDVSFLDVVIGCV